MIKTKWRNDIELTYEIELMDSSKKSIEEAVDNMLAGVTIGTIQTSAGNYTPKEQCMFGTIPGAFKGGIKEIKGISENRYRAIINFSSDISQTTEMGFAGLLSVAAGDGYGTAYEMKKIILKDIKMPENVLTDFPGPQFGDMYIRKKLGIENLNKPLTALLLKPNTGQITEHYARFAKEAAMGGINYIKEDELQFNHINCPLEERVVGILKVLEEVKQKNGRQILYAPNITAGSQKMIIENAKKVVDLGAEAVMINVMQVGLDTLRVLTEANIGVPIHIHRAGHDNFTRGDFGIDIYVLNKLFRLGGADLIHTGPVFGNLYNPDDVVKNIIALQNNSNGMKKSLPILSRSSIESLQDSINYIGTNKEVVNPGNVMFLVDKGVYDFADKKTGDITYGVEKFVEQVNNIIINRHISKNKILEAQNIL
jgi:ribulose-bisphosphate carboxylase large chain